MVVFFAAFAIAGPAVIAVRRADSGGGGGASAATVTANGKTSGGADAPLVTMRNLKFQPSTLTVKRGTEVRFDNADVAPHTVTGSGGSPDSGIIGPGGSFKLRIDDKLDYVCTVHPSMKATIELTG